MLKAEDMATTMKDIENMWSLYDTGVKNRFGIMEISVSNTDERLYSIIKRSLKYRRCLLALRENNYGCGKVLEGLMVRKEINFDILDDIDTDDERIFIYCSDLQYVEMGDGVELPCISISESDECEQIYSFSSFDIIRATYGTKKLKEMTEKAIHDFENKEYANGWVEMVENESIASLIARTTSNEIAGGKYKILYTYSLNNCSYLVLAMTKENSQSYLNIMKYDDILEEKLYKKAEEVPVSDPHFLDVVDRLVDYSTDLKWFKGLGIEIKMTEHEFKKLYLDCF